MPHVNWDIITSPILDDFYANRRTSDHLRDFARAYAPHIHTWYSLSDHPTTLGYIDDRGVAGVAEFERFWLRGEIQSDRFKFRMVSEDDGPLDPFPCWELLAQLDPTMNVEAECWRWRSWNKLGKQVPVYKGMGVTYHIGSDRYPYVVTECSPKRKSATIMHVEYKLVEGSILSENQHYHYQRVPHGNQSWQILPSRRQADAGTNRWRFQSGPGYYHVGYMDAYRDPSY